MTASHSSIVMFTSIRSRRMPALFTRTSRQPNVVDGGAHEAARALEVRDVLAVGDRLTSQARGSRRRPRRPGPSSRPSPSTSAPRSLTTTLAPWRASSIACAPADAATRPRDDRHASLAEPASRRPPSSRAAPGRRPRARSADDVPLDLARARVDGAGAAGEEHVLPLARGVALARRAGSWPSCRRRRWRARRRSGGTRSSAAWRPTPRARALCPRRATTACAAPRSA